MAIKYARNLLALQERHDFDLVGLQTVRIKIFGVPNVGNRNNYPMRTGNVMLVVADENNKVLYKCG